MVAAVIVCVLLMFVMLAWTVAVTILGYKILRSNFEIQDRLNIHMEFFDMILESLNNDTVFFRSSLAKKLSMEIPEVSDMNKQLLDFENRIIQIKSMIQSYKMDGD